MITKELLIAFVNLQKAMEVKDVKCNSNRLSFVAPSRLCSIIIDTFEPTYGIVVFSELNSKDTLYVIQ